MPREKIVRDFAEWAAFSSTRSGCPIKSRKAVYPLIRKPNYGEIFDGDLITQEEFERWHEINTMAICRADCRLPIGWAVKLINIYLKTRVYIAREGREGLIKCIHPPIDNGLWNGIKQKYDNEFNIIDKTHTVSRIKDIATYELYKKIIEGCRLIAQKRKSLLVEVEELWDVTMPQLKRRVSQNIRIYDQNQNIRPIPITLLDRACQMVGNIPFPHRAIKITRNLIKATMEILNAEPDKRLPQNARNAMMGYTPDGLDKRIKKMMGTNLRTANIISDVLANAGILEIVQIENHQTGRMVKGTKLLEEWSW